MNRLLATVVAVAVLAAAAVPSASGLLFSPLLLRANPWGVAARNASSRSQTIAMAPPILSQAPEASSPAADFGHDDDLMRYKHELLSAVYEKSLTRGFDGDAL